MYVFKAAVLGGGTMGGEIAQTIAAADIPVVVKDIEQKFVDAAAKSGKPFFVWFNTTRMHVWTHLKPSAQGRTGIGIYPDGLVEHDDMVGQVLKQHDDLKIADNTIVVYGTDNGAETVTWPDGGTTPFHGEKGTTWEGGFRVPMLVRWPGVVKPGVLLCPSDMGRVRFAGMHGYHPSEPTADAVLLATVPVERPAAHIADVHGALEQAHSAQCPCQHAEGSEPQENQHAAHCGHGLHAGLPAIRSAAVTSAAMPSASAAS